ncbi:MAG: hypothetical protein ABSE63_08400 [Thermoguttaceae bacterium]
MKVLTGLVACCWALAALFSAELCRADDVFLASMGHFLAMSDVNQSSVAPSLDGDGYADPLRGQKQSGVYYSPKESPENDGLSYSDLSPSPPDNAGPSGDSRAASENADSPFERYLLILIAGGTVGLVLVAAGIAQFWRRRSISNYWLFPTVQDDGESAAPGASSPAHLVAKKQMETLPEEKINKPAQRRAA